MLRKALRRLLPEYRLTWPHLQWWDDPWFNSYLDRFAERNGLNTQRRWTLYQLMRLLGDVPGDTAECGVYEGAGSYLIAWMNQRSNHERTHFLCDSFEGLSEPQPVDGGHWARRDLSVDEATVMSNMAEFPDIELHKGWIPDCFTGLEGNRFALVHIDVDLYQPTRDSVEFFYPRMNEGGIILCDDYGFTTCPGATEAMDVFFSDRPESVVSLSAGSGFIVKGRHTEDDAI